ncbi:MAG: hypothetical protein EBS23_05940 [Betaproteobacteria bacterium]|nr:hypothetical protein [Betaproteobacteria bacterium]
MTTMNIYDMVDTWAVGGTTFTAIKMNVTDTASAAGSLLMDLQVGGVSQFRVSKGGRITAQTLTIGLGGQTAVATNTALGVQALNSASLTGDNNAGVGYQALFSNTTGSSNSAVGQDALRENTTGSNSTAVGVEAGRRFVASQNTALGYRALFGGDATPGNNTGTNNIAIGFQAGDAITTGSTNIVIGHDIDVDSATGSNQINIGDRYFHDRIRLLERTSDPAKPAEGNMIVWMSDGTGLGDDGDVIIASTAGGVTNYAILFDHSAGTLWP